VIVVHHRGTALFGTSRDYPEKTNVFGPVTNTPMGNSMELVNLCQRLMEIAGRAGKGNVRKKDEISP